MHHVNLFDSGFKSSASRDANESAAIFWAMKTFRDRYGHAPTDAARVRVYRGERLSRDCTLGAYLRTII